MYKHIYRMKFPVFDIATWFSAKNFTVVSPTHNSNINTSKDTLLKGNLSFKNNR